MRVWERENDAGRENGRGRMMQEVRRAERKRRRMMQEERIGVGE